MSLLLHLVLLSDPRASTVDLSGGVAVELRGGRAPVTPVSDPTPAVSTTVTPVARLHYAGRSHVTAATLSYSPRLFFRLPNQAQLRRPLLLHSLLAQLSRRVSPRWAVDTSLASDVGAVDYTSIQAVFGDQQGGAPSSTVTQYASVAGSVLISGAITQAQFIEIEPSAVFRTPFGASTEAPPAEDPFVDPALQRSLVLPRQISAGSALRYGAAVSPVDTVSGIVDVQYVDFDARGANVLSSAGVAWQRSIREGLSTEVTAGLYGVAPVRDPEDDGIITSAAGVQPLASAELTGALLNRSRARLTGTVGANNGAFLDGVTGEILPRVGVFSRLDLSLPPRWTVGAQFNASTVATLEPAELPPTVDPASILGVAAQQQRTVLSWRLPVTVQFENFTALEFGTLGSVRGPHLRADNFELRQLETWLYVRFTFDIGTGHVRARRRRGEESEDGSGRRDDEAEAVVEDAEAADDAENDVEADDEPADEADDEADDVDDPTSSPND